MATVIVLAAGRSGALAAGVWLVLAARPVGAIAFVRVQIARLRRGVVNTGSSDAVQVVAVVIGVVAVAVERRMLAGLAGLVMLAGFQVMWVRRPPVVAKVLGLRQMALGVGWWPWLRSGCWRHEMCRWTTRGDAPMDTIDPMTTLGAVALSELVRRDMRCAPLSRPRLSLAEVVPSAV